MRILSPAHKWLQVYRTILITVAIVSSFFVEYNHKVFLLTAVLFVILTFMVIMTFKVLNNSFFISLEPYPAMITDIILISVLVNVTGGSTSVFHTLYVVQFVVISYFYGYKETVVAGLVASVGFYFAAVNEYYVVHALMTLLITFGTAMFVAFLAQNRHYVLQLKSGRASTYSEESYSRQVLDSLTELAFAMNSDMELEDIVDLIDAYVQQIGYAERAIFVLPENKSSTVFLKDISKNLPPQHLVLKNDKFFLKIRQYLPDEVTIIADTRRDKFFKSWLSGAKSVDGLFKFIQKFKSAILTPISNGNDVFGYIVIANCSHIRAFGAEEGKMVATLKHALAVYLKTLDTTLKLERKYDEIVHMSAKMVDLKDPYTHQHSQRVADIVTQIGTELGLKGEHLSKIETASLLHDIGKVGIPDAVLNKSVSLDADEFALIQAHPHLGEELIRTVSGLEAEAVWVGQHHERFDGKGYPRGLAGANIALEARIISVADAYEAMTSDRAYRARLSHQQALAEIRHNVGSQFDARVVEALLSVEQLIKREQNAC